MNAVHLALKHPERASALIAYDEGLKKFRDPIKVYWADGSTAHRKALEFLVRPETARFQYTDGMSDVSRIDPDNQVHDQALPDRPGNMDIQLDLFHDYGSNVPLYPKIELSSDTGHFALEAGALGTQITHQAHLAMMRVVKPHHRRWLFETPDLSYVRFS